jgi:hypothetical protein
LTVIEISTITGKIGQLVYDYPDGRVQSLGGGGLYFLPEIERWCEENHPFNKKSTTSIQQSKKERKDPES